MSEDPTLTPRGRAGTDFPIVLYDGECGFCDASVMWVVDRDDAGVFHFAPLQSPLGSALLAEHGLVFDGDTMVLVEGGEVHLRSEAGLRVASRLRAPWSWLGSLALWVPRFLRDAVYRLVASNRFRIAGKVQSCRRPDPSWRDRFHGELAG